MQKQCRLLAGIPKMVTGGGVPGPGESGERWCHLLSLPRSVCPATALLEFSLIFKHCSVQKGKLIHTKVEGGSYPCVPNAWDEKLSQTRLEPQALPSLGAGEENWWPLCILSLLCISVFHMIKF